MYAGAENLPSLGNRRSVYLTRFSARICRRDVGKWTRAFARGFITKSKTAA